MNAHRRQYQYVYHHRQVYHVIPGYAVLVSMCIFMLPMLKLAAEHVQLPTVDSLDPIIQWHLHPHHVTFSHATVVLTSLNNVLPAIALQNRGVRSNIGCLSSHFSICRVPPNLVPVPACVGRVVLVLLLLMSGDIELNPGPVG